MHLMYVYKIEKRGFFLLKYDKLYRKSLTSIVNANSLIKGFTYSSAVIKDHTSYMYTKQYGSRFSNVHTVGKIDKKYLKELHKRESLLEPMKHQL